MCGLEGSPEGICEAQNFLDPNPKEMKRRGATQQQPPVTAADGVSDSALKLVDRQRNLQEQLTDDLVDLSSR